MSFTAAGLIAYAFLMVYLSIGLAPSDFWIERTTPSGILNMDLAFNTIFGQGLWIIVGSLVAFLIGQIVDVTVFHYLRGFTGSSKIWLRATGSTLVSQFIDSFVVLFIAFYIGAGWDLTLVLAIGVVNYIYKFFVAVLLDQSGILAGFLHRRLLLQLHYQKLLVYHHHSIAKFFRYALKQDFAKPSDAGLLMLLLSFHLPASLRYSPPYL